jgi:hypothetical protein
MIKFQIFKKSFFRDKSFFLNFFVTIMICSAVQAQSSVNDLSSALSKLKKHVDGTTVLTASQITEQTTLIEKNISMIGQNESVIADALNLIKIFDVKEGPLFINTRTKSGLSPTNHTGVELDWAMFELQQGILDFACTPANILQYPSLFSRAIFETSKYFPGAVAPPSDPQMVNEAQVNCSMPEVKGVPVMYSTAFVRRPTGNYLAPGSIVTVTVPPSLVNCGFNIRVGAHSWDLEAKPTYKRLNRVSLVYPITATETRIVNPLGGGIYIEVPYKADKGIITVKIANAVRSPFFSARSFAKTTLSDWQNIERKHPGPWADFESDKFMMQLPASWIYNYNDPVTLMKDWDEGMDAVSELFGLPLIRNITVLYLQIDVVMRGDANYPGYPQSNYPYNPVTVENGNKNHFVLRGPQYSDWTVFHELGHSQLFTKFNGETEAAVNLLSVAMQNKKFGMSLDDAYGNSVSGMKQVSLDQGAIMWMVTENFRKGNPMDISNSESNEVRYQHRGHGKYVEIARIFGWNALSNFWLSVHQDYAKGITYPTNTDPTDNRMLRMSQAAGADLRPLIHFWGIQPVDQSGLKASITTLGLKPSKKIYDMLKHYQTIIPMNNLEFRNHARVIYPSGITQGSSPLYGEGWYYTWLPLYAGSHGTAAQKTLQNIIDLYFPNGDPDIINSAENLDDQNLLMVYPNPASEVLHIKGTETVEQIEISDLNGKLIHAFSCKSNDIDISSLNPGIYLIRLKSKKQFVIQKFIKI